MEDDPYYYLQYKAGEAPRGLSGLGESYLSMDTESRVMRLDSFSKVQLSHTRSETCQTSLMRPARSRAWCLSPACSHDEVDQIQIKVLICIQDLQSQVHMLEVILSCMHQVPTS